MSGPAEELRPGLLAGIEQLGLTLSERQVDQLLIYLTELDKWNRAYNLSAVRDIRAMVGRHLLDSLSVLPHLELLAPDRVIDVGTGGGLPGIPLAIAMPGCQFTLLDSNGKKTRFLFHVKTRLGLDNVRVEHSRAEDYSPESGYPVVVSRAFASLEDMTGYCCHLLARKGVYLAMKGVFPEAELASLADSHRLVAGHRLAVPDTDGERHLVLLQPH